MRTRISDSTSFARAALRTAALGAAVAALAFDGTRDARASIPAGPPTFGAPTVFTNTFFPFEPGALKVYAGKSDGERTTVVDVYREDTRDFTLGGATVTCRVLQETEFEDGALVEISLNYFAQSDDGSVWYFGEVVDDYEDGVVTDHGGSWLVGGPSGDDPPETMTTAAPALYMPANPEVGDQYRPEDVEGGPQEIDTVERLGRTVRVPAGKFTDCMQVGELSLPDEHETKWWAPGVGVILAKGHREVLKLVSATFTAD